MPARKVCPYPRDEGGTHARTKVCLYPHEGAARRRVGCLPETGVVLTGNGRGAYRKRGRAYRRRGTWETDGPGEGQDTIIEPGVGLGRHPCESQNEMCGRILHFIYDTSKLLQPSMSSRSSA